MELKQLVIYRDTIDKKLTYNIPVIMRWLRIMRAYLLIIHQIVRQCCFNVGDKNLLESELLWFYDYSLKLNSKR